MARSRANLRRSGFGRDAAFVKQFGVGSLIATATQLRQEVRQVRARDVVDWIDFFATLERSVIELRKAIISGAYSPSPPSRYEYPKGKGAYRIVTVPSIRDAIVYRHISDEALRRAIDSKVQGAFFSRRFSATAVGPTFNFDPVDPYYKFFVVWLTYHQYRSRTLLSQPHDVLVVTDISNFFDSIQHELLLEYLAPLGLPRKSVGLLGRLLEAFKPRAGHSPNPRVGIPQDELDCSRQLAHLFLFEHDRRVVTKVGEARFVRWMDDQNIGTSSMSEARRVVNLPTRSLSQQLLTLNAGKTLFLSPDEVVSHFHLETNDELQKWNDKWGYPKGPPDPLSRAHLRRIWRNALVADGVGKGHWDKVLKRFYAYAVQADFPDLEARALEDLINYPGLDDRIFGYFARRDRVGALISLFHEYNDLGENLYESTENAFFEAALLTRPVGTQLRDVRNLAKRHAGGTKRPRALPRASAVLALYWFGIPPAELVALYKPGEAASLPKEVARTWLACVFALDPTAITAVQRALLGHPSDDVARLSQFLVEIESGAISDVGKLPARRPRWPSPGDYFDARSWLLLEILSRSPNPKILLRVRSTMPLWTKTIRGNPERRIANRINSRILRAQSSTGTCKVHGQVTRIPSAVCAAAAAGMGCP